MTGPTRFAIYTHQLMPDFSSNCFVCKEATTSATNCCDKLMCSSCYHKRSQCPDCNNTKRFNERLVAKTHFIDGKYYCACGAVGHQRNWNSHFNTHKPYVAAPRISIGSTAGQAQGHYTVAIGSNAGQSQQRRNAISIGSTAGQSVAAPRYVAPGPYVVAIGSTAGQSRQGRNAVAIGSTAGQSPQGRYAVAIGGQILVRYGEKLTYASTRYAN